MFYQAIEGKVEIDKTDMDYIAFGRGEETLIIIPGLGDGLRTVKGTRFVIARIYRIFASCYRVYVFSRKNLLKEGYTTRDMAMDLKKGIDKLGIKRAHIMGISQGGMIAQYLAIDYPDLLNKLVLAVSISKQNTIIQDVVGGWINLARMDDYKSLIIDTMEKTYSEDRLKKYRKFYPLVSRIGRPKNFNRFIIQAESCLGHDSYDELNKITKPTLILGGDNDKIVGSDAGPEMAEKIAGSKLITYEGLGHGAYEEAKGFNQQILDFLGD